MNHRKIAYAWCVGTMLFMFAAAAQEVDEVLPEIYPSLAAEGRQPIDFVPKGWVIERQINGDLNQDGLSDWVLVVQQNDAKNIIHHGKGESWAYQQNANPRMLAVLLAQKNGVYRAVLQNHTLIPRNDNDGLEDALSENGGVSISRGRLKVNVHFFASVGSWTMSETEFTFRYEQGCFRLIGYDYSGVHRSSGETNFVSVNYLTRKIIRSTGNISTDESTSRTQKIVQQAPICLDDIGNGWDFEVR